MVVIKHVFRDDFSFEKMDDQCGKAEMQAINSEKAHAIESMMFLLVIKIRRMPLIRQPNGGASGIAMKKWNDIYSSYGNTP